MSDSSTDPNGHRVPAAAGAKGATPTTQPAATAATATGETRAGNTQAAADGLGAAPAAGAQAGRNPATQAAGTPTTPALDPRRYATVAPPDWPVIVNGVMVPPFDPPRYTAEEAAIGLAREVARAGPRNSHFWPGVRVPPEVIWQELPKVEREWWFEIGTRDDVPYLGLHDNWGNAAEVSLSLSSRSHAPLVKLIREYMETNGEDVVDE